MTPPLCKRFSFLVGVWILLAMTIPATAAEKIWGGYEKKLDGHRVSLTLQPIGGNEKSGRVSVIFNYIENTGADLEIDGAGILKGDTVTIYQGRYKLTTTVRDGAANFQIAESCGGHRFYEGYGHYSEECTLGRYKALLQMSQSLKKKK